MTDKSTRRAARLAADYVQPADVRAMQDMGPDVLAGVLAAVRTATRHDGQDVESLACMLAPRLFLAATDGKDTADRAARAARVARRQALAAVTSATLETYGDPADLADDTRTTASAYRPDPAAAYDYGTADVIDLALTDVARREGWTLATAVGLARHKGADLADVTALAATVTLPNLRHVHAALTGDHMGAGMGTGWQAHPHHTSAQGGDRTPRQGVLPTTVTITRDGVTTTRDLTAAEEEAMTGRTPTAQGPTCGGCTHTSCRTLSAQHARQADRDSLTDGEGPTHAAQSAQAAYTPVPSGKVPVSPRKRSRGGSTGPTVPTTLARD